MEQKMALLTERRKQYQEESTTSTNIENENVPTVVKEILDELVEQICY
ncbi:unnamed protein product, partial [Rotaria magnacalcarata]